MVLYFSTRKALKNYSIHPFNKFFSGSLLNIMTRYFPFLLDITSPAASNAERCFAIACREMESSCFIIRRAESSYNVISLRSDSSSKISCRKYVQDRLGHGSIQNTSDIYAHISKKIDQSSKEKFESYTNKLLDK